MGRPRCAHVRVFACARARANMYVYGGHSRSQVCVTERGCARERMHVRMQFGAALVQYIFVLSFSFIYSFDLFDHWRLLVHHLFFICSFQHSKETPDNEGPRSHIFRKSVWHPPGHHADIKCMVDSTTGATETFAKHRTYEGHACLFFGPRCAPPACRQLVLAGSICSIRSGMRRCDLWASEHRHGSRRSLRAESLA